VYEIIGYVGRAWKGDPGKPFKKVFPCTPFPKNDGSMNLSFFDLISGLVHYYEEITSYTHTWGEPPPPSPPTEVYILNSSKEWLPWDN
jgi:hypothetical protein